MPLTYQQALEYINSFDDPYLAALRDHGKQTWGLAGIRRVLAQLGDPHFAYPTIHVAGTKGKGSTSAFIAQGLMAAGLKTGLYTSPHIVDWRERIQVDRAPITEQALAQLVEDFRSIGEGLALSAFEVTTALALWHFARERCNAAVIEVGLGGRLDATSVVEPVVAVITSISLDHTQLLGSTTAEIAAEKAAIIKPGIPVVSAPQPDDALAVIEARAHEQGSRLVLVGRDVTFEVISEGWDGSEALIDDGERQGRYHIGLSGRFQVENAAVALAALRKAQRMGLPVTDEAITTGLAETHWAGRLEVVAQQPRIILDSAHNPYSIGRLVESLQGLLAAEGTPPHRLTFVFGCMADKDAAGMLDALLPTARRVIVVQSKHSRAAPAEDLLVIAQRITEQARAAGSTWASGIELVAARDMPDALERALTSLGAGETLCITGSLAIVGEAHQALDRRGN